MSKVQGKINMVLTIMEATFLFSETHSPDSCPFVEITSKFKGVGVQDSVFQPLGGWYHKTKNLNPTLNYTPRSYT